MITTAQQENIEKMFFDHAENTPILPDYISEKQKQISDLRNEINAKVHECNQIGLVPDESQEIQNMFSEIANIEKSIEKLQARFEENINSGAKNGKK